VETYGGAEIQLHAFFISAQDGGERSASRSGSFTPEERFLQHNLDRRLSGSIASVDALENRRILLLPESKPRSSSPSQSLQWIGYSCSLTTVLAIIIVAVVIEVTMQMEQQKLQQQHLVPVLVPCSVGMTSKDPGISRPLRYDCPWRHSRLPLLDAAFWFPQSNKVKSYESCICC
jgi:hypothetical protein